MPTTNPQHLALLKAVLLNYCNTRSNMQVATERTLSQLPEKRPRVRNLRKGLTASNQSRHSGSTTAGRQALGVSVAPAN